MAHRLETPESSQDLYRARGGEVIESRPWLTGDVFENVSMFEPDGSASGPLTVMVTTHPCSLRTDGVTLTPKINVLRVDQYQVLKSWEGNFRVFPLPDLYPGREGNARNAAARIREPYIATPAQLAAGQRVACLTAHGINLLLQRLANEATRHVVPTVSFHEANSAVYEEADVIEDWCFEYELMGRNPSTAADECMAWLREALPGGGTRQEMLKSSQLRSTVRQQMLKHFAGLRTGSES